MKRIISFILSIAMLTAIMPAAFAEELKKYTVTAEYDHELASVILMDNNNDNTVIPSGGEITASSNGVAMVRVNIAPLVGYRIKSVIQSGGIERMENGEIVDYIDRTDTFIKRSYSVFLISSDTSFKIEVEKIPETFPQIIGGKITDYETGEEISDKIVITDETRLLAVPEFDDADTNAAFAGCYFEYSTDGEAWYRETAWGNRFDFWGGWSDHEFDFVNTHDYYIRAYIFGNNDYSVGSYYTEPILCNATDGSGSDDEFFTVSGNVILPDGVTFDEDTGLTIVIYTGNWYSTSQDVTVLKGETSAKYSFPIKSGNILRTISVWYRNTDKLLPKHLYYDYTNDRMVFNGNGLDMKKEITANESYDLQLVSKRQINVSVEFEDGIYAETEADSDYGCCLSVSAVAVSQTTGEKFYSPHTSDLTISEPWAVSIEVPDKNDTYKIHVSASPTYEDTDTNASCNVEYWYSESWDYNISLTEEDADIITPGNDAYKFTIPKALEIPVTIDFPSNAYINNGTVTVQMNIENSDMNDEFYGNILSWNPIHFKAAEKRETKIFLPYGKDNDYMSLYYEMSASEENTDTNILLNTRYTFSVPETEQTVFDRERAAQGFNITIPTLPVISGKISLPDSYVDDKSPKEANLIFYDKNGNYLDSEYIIFENGNTSFSLEIPENAQNKECMIALFPDNFGGNIVRKRLYYTKDGEAVYFDTSKSIDNVVFELEEGYVISGTIDVPDSIELKNPRQAWFSVMAWDRDKTDLTREYLDEHGAEGDYYSSDGYESETIGETRSFPFSIVVPKNTHISLGIRGHISHDIDNIYDDEIFYKSENESSVFPDEALNFYVDSDISGIKIPLIAGNTAKISVAAAKDSKAEPSGFIYLSDENGKMINSCRFYMFYAGRDVEEQIVIPQSYTKAYLSYKVNKLRDNQYKPENDVIRDREIFVNPDGSWTYNISDAVMWDLMIPSGETMIPLNFRVLTETEATEEAANTKFIFRDTSTGNKISNARLTLTDESEKTYYKESNSIGECGFTLADGKYKCEVYADGYNVRSFFIERTDKNNEFTVYLNKDDLINVETKVREMSQEEIIEAGIDPSSLDNNQIYRFTAVLEFEPGDKLELDYICDGDKVIKSDTVKRGNIMIIPAAKDVYLIIHSSVTWQKEMFMVTLLAQNTSSTETMENVSANLTLPEGVSLADMKDKTQYTGMSLGTIAPNEQKRLDWYLCGDTKGEYYLNGEIKATRVGGGISEDFNQRFTTKEPITVLAGDAMELSIEAEKKAVVGTPYKVNFNLQNVSKKTLYNVALNVLGGKFVNEYSVSDLQFDAESGTPLTGNLEKGFSASKEEFVPGDSLSGTFTITFGKGIDTEDNIKYMLTNMFLITGAGSTALIPTKINLKDTVEKHSWDSGTVTKRATCTENGEIVYKCTGCGSEKTQQIPATGHNMSEFVTETDSTCTENGTLVSKCQNSGCDYKETKTKFAKGHSWDTTITVDREKTCTEDGEKSIHCTRCSERKDIEIIPKGHEMGDWTPLLPATCTDKGTEVQKCTVCEYEITRDTDALGHDWDTLYTTDSSASCTADGEKSIHCKRCSERKDITKIPATGHNMGAYSITVNETCETDGEEVSKCQNSGCTHTNTRIRKALGHDWDSGVVIKQPTESEKGTVLYTCKRCNKTRTSYLDFLARQEVEFANPGDITITYGEFEYINNDAYNDSENGGALTFSSSDESVATVNERGRVKIISAGVTTITATAAKTDKYAETKVQYKLFVKKAPLTLNVNKAEIFYPENAPEFSFTAEGFVFNEDNSVLSGTAAYKTDYEPFKNAGDYKIELSGLDAKNYDITVNAGTLTVKKAQKYTLTLENLTQRKGNVTGAEVKISPRDDTAKIKTEYKNTNGEWQEAVPEDIGMYEVRAKLAGSENIEADEAYYAFGTLTIKAGAIIDLGGDESIGVKTDIDQNKAEFSIEDEDLKKLMDNIPSDGEVVINAKGSTDGVNEITLPQNLVDAIDKDEKAKTLTVLADDAEISMSTEVIKTVSDKLKPDDKVSIHIESVDKDSLSEKQQKALDSLGSSDAVILQLNLVVSHFDSDGNKTSEDIHELNGNVDVRSAFTLPENMQGKKILVCYVANDGSVSYARAKYEDGFVSFTTNHFSHFAVMAISCPHVWDSGTVILQPTTTKEGKKKYTCTLCDETKEETIPKKETSSSGGGGGGGNNGIISGAVSTPAPEKTENLDNQAEKTKNPFVDVHENEWFFDAVKYAYENGLMNGVSDTEFAPSDDITRAMFVTVLYRIEKEPQTEASVFKDVENGSYYENAVGWANANGIVQGVSDTEFAPNERITREQMAAIVYRYAKFKGYDISAVGNMNYTDTENISDYAKDAIIWAAERAIMLGNSDGSFAPKANTTRAQAAAVFMRILENLM